MIPCRCRLVGGLEAHGLDMEPDRGPRVISLCHWWRTTKGEKPYFR